MPHLDPLLDGVRQWLAAEHIPHHNLPDVQALLNQRLARIPLGFMGDGRDSASAALFLASEDARFITGTEIVVDGGMTVRCG